MRILICNDDGIEAESLRLLVEWATKLGEVTVVAPKVEQSGKSQGIDIIHSFEVKEVDLFPGVKAYACNSTPADCARFGIMGLKIPYDLVLSGINRGYNLGKDIAYSGTVGVVSEAANWGLRSIAFSTAPSQLQDAAKQLDMAYAFIMENHLFDYHLIYNVNFPKEPKGIHLTRQGGAYYTDEFVREEGDLYRQVGDFVYYDENNMALDTDSVMHGYISVTPLTLERTELSTFEKLSHLHFQEGTKE